MTATASYVPPDLLNFAPRCTLDSEKTDLAIVFAFAGSTSGGLFVDALAQTTLPATTWDASAFEHDLFVSDFVRTCFSAELSGKPVPLVTAHIKRLLTAPPSDLDTVHFRRSILAELSGNVEKRTAFEHVYRTLSRFRGLLEGTSARGGWDQNRRQLDLLRLFEEIIVALTAPFADSQSGLARLCAFGQAVQGSEAYQSLGQLLKYDERLATVTFQMGIGADGRVRQLELVKVEENASNVFVVSPWKRWLQRFELMFRGYRLSEAEVMARYLDAVFEGVRPHLVALVQLFGDLEFYLGALGFWQRATRHGLSLCFPEFVSPNQPRRLLGVWNPLLFGAGATPVPCDVVSERHDVTVMITGPNSGGKTRLLQSLGLTQLLAQAGLCVPARAATMSLAPGLVVSLLQETRVDQTEGRLGVELMRIRSLFERLPAGALVLLDELCSGTNPSEGEEIVELVLKTLSRLHPQAYITTHFLEFASRLHEHDVVPGLRFLQVALGPNQTPTYQFAPGVAKSSMAGVAAARLGVTGEQLAALVERQLAR